MLIVLIENLNYIDNVLKFLAYHIFVFLF